MSGGRFNYADCNLKSEMFGFVDEPYNVMEDDEISELVWDVLNLIHDLDYYQSGDTCRETYIESKKEFKKFSENSPLLVWGMNRIFCSS